MSNPEAPGRQPPSRHPSGAAPIALVARPIAWLFASAAGFVLACAGIAIDVHRHDNGAAAAALISASNQGTLVAMAGLAIAALGLLAALSLIALGGAPSPEAVVRRGAGVIVAWVAVAGAGAGVMTYAVTAGITLGHDSHTAASAVSIPSPPATTVTPAATNVPGAVARATLRGTLTLDGAPLDAQFLGARVERDGLSAACQVGIDPVAGGRYEIKVMADAEALGCGAVGGRIVLWTSVPSVANEILFSRETAPWPGDGAAATFDAGFSKGSAAGATTPDTEFNGEVADRDGAPMPGGTVVEAYAGETRCGAASTRYSGFVGYVLIVAGPTRPGCAKDAPLTFRINGRPAAQTATNDLNRSTPRPGPLNLTIK